MPPVIRPRRSVLFMPGSNARALERAKTLPADALIFDLEDAVAPDAKETARQMVCDAVHLDLNDDEGFAYACRQAVDMGFDGKTLIHRKTIAAANRMFAPSPEDIESARKIIAAYTEATAQGRGVVVVDGRLIENLHVEEAHRVVALAEAIAEREARGNARAAGNG